MMGVYLIYVYPLLMGLMGPAILYLFVYVFVLLFSTVHLHVRVHLQMGQIGQQNMCVCNFVFLHLNCLFVCAHCVVHRVHTQLHTVHPLQMGLMGPARLYWSIFNFVFVCLNCAIACAVHIVHIGVYTLCRWA